MLLGATEQAINAETQTALHKLKTKLRAFALESGDLKTTHHPRRVASQSTRPVRRMTGSKSASVAAMWRRWWRQPEVVLIADAGDDATAALTTILRFHGRSVSIAEVKQVLERDETGCSHAGHVVAAAEHFRLRVQGIFVEDGRCLGEVSTPSIAHMSMTPGSFPRPLGTVDDSYFSVVVAISESRVREIDPYRGQFNWARSDFMSHATGVFLTFDAASPLPRMRLSQA